METGLTDGQMDAPTVRRDDDGDPAAILPIELTQCGLLGTVISRRGRAMWAQSTGRVLDVQPHVIHAGIARRRSTSQSPPSRASASRSTASAVGASAGRPRR